MSQLTKKTFKKMRLILFNNCYDVEINKLDISSSLRSNFETKFTFLIIVDLVPRARFGNSRTKKGRGSGRGGKGEGRGGNEF